MTEPNDRAYYRRRAEMSWQMAAKASEPAIAAIHRELALRYEALAEPDTAVVLRLQVAASA